MVYCTEDDLKKAIPAETLEELTNDEQTGEIVTETVTEAIGKADSIIDGYIGSRYTLPLSSVPEMVKDWSVVITIYKLYVRKVAEVPEAVKDEYKGAIAELKRVEDGKKTLPISEPGESGFSMSASISSHF